MNCDFGVISSRVIAISSIHHITLLLLDRLRSHVVIAARTYSATNSLITFQRDAMILSCFVSISAYSTGNSVCISRVFSLSCRLFD